MFGNLIHCSNASFLPMSYYGRRGLKLKGTPGKSNRQACIASMLANPHHTVITQLAWHDMLSHGSMMTRYPRTLIFRFLQVAQPLLGLPVLTIPAHWLQWSTFCMVDIRLREPRRIEYN